MLIERECRVQKGKKKESRMTRSNRSIDRPTRNQHSLHLMRNRARLTCIHCALARAGALAQRASIRSAVGYQAACRGAGGTRDTRLFVRGSRVGLKPVAFQRRAWDYPTLYRVRVAIICFRYRSKCLRVRFLQVAPKRRDASDPLGRT